MSYNNAIELLKVFIKLFVPRSVSNNFTKSTTLKYPKGFKSNNNIYAKNETINTENNKTIPKENNEPYNNSNVYSTIRNNCRKKQQDAFLNSQGLIDSIAQDLTPARFQQAIIFSEIIGKPKSKTKRKRRGF